MEGNIYIQQIQGAVELEIEVLNGKANSLKTTCLYIYIKALLLRKGKQAQQDTHREEYEGGL